MGNRYPFLAEHGYDIDEQARTATLPTDAVPQTLFYYWTGSRNKPYTGLKRYGAGKDYKPAAGRVTLTSPIGRGIIHDIKCADEGTLTVAGDIEPCKIGLYCVTVTAKGQDSLTYNILVGKNESGRVLSGEECDIILDMPVAAYTEGEHKTACWLKYSGRNDWPSELNELVSRDDYIQKYLAERAAARDEETERMKLRTSSAKTSLEHALGDIRAEVAALERDAGNAVNRIAQMTAQKRLTVLRRKLREKEERLYYDCMKLDDELDGRMEEFINGGKVSCDIQRQFVLTVTGTKN